MSTPPSLEPAAAAEGAEASSELDWALVGLMFGCVFLVIVFICATVTYRSQLWRR